jgi:acetolactate synthase-1/2/3 large subunit
MKSEVHTLEKYLGSEAFVEVLNAHGVENIFFNPGSVTTPIQTTISKYRTAGIHAPRLVLCLDEATTLTAAHGHYMVSGRPQFAMVHCELGTQRVGGALLNAQFGRIPVILWAGLQIPSSPRTNWKQEPYDQGLIVRNSVKWDYQISSGENIHDVLQKAFRITFAEPCGPVYLSFPGDILLEKIDRVEIPPSALTAVSSTVPADIDRLSRAAEMLIEAENPLIIAGYSGRHHQSVSFLVELAETLCAPVVTSQVWLNFPHTHPLCAGIEQIRGSRDTNPFADADVLLVIDYDMPYAGTESLPGPDAKIIHIDLDPLTRGRPLWGRGADIFIEADSREAIPALQKLISQKLTPETRGRFQERYERLAGKHRKQRESWHALAMSKAEQKPISPDWICRCIADVVDEDAIIVNFTISPSASVTEQIPRTRPGTVLGNAGGSVEWALGAALGAKLAAPDRTVVSVMTDGGFIWSGPVATLWTARAYHAPFLSVILNNQGYNVIRKMIQKGYGENKLTDEAAFEAGVEISPPPDFALVAQACGAYGRMVEDPAEVLPALREALDQVRLGRPAVLDVRIARE